MATLTTRPALPIAGRQASLTFAPVASGSNYTRIWLTNAPVGSPEREQIDRSERGRIQFYAGPGAQIVPFVPAVGGVYRFVSQDYVQGATAYGGGYQDDPNGAPSETKVSGEFTLSLTVGQRIEQTVGVGSDTATLRLWVWGDDIEATTFDEHGEVTPALVEPRSARAALACESSAVRTELDGLIGLSVGTALGSPSALVAEMVTDINTHLASGASVHNAADSDNTIPVGFGNDVNAKTLPASVNRILEALKKHFANDAGTGVDSGDYHELTGAKKNDNLNAPLFNAVADLESAYAALADILRSYEAHRLSLSVHGVGGGNSISGLPPCLRVHKEFLAVLAANAPTAPNTVNSGVVTAIALAGFRPS